MPYTEWLQLGFHGLAFAMLFLSYQLIKPLVSKDSDDQDREDEEALRIKLRYVLGFMAISILFFVGGVVADLYSRTQPHEIGVFISPAQMPPKIAMPKIRNGELAVELSEDGYAKLLVKNSDTLRIAVDDVTKRVDYLATLVGEMTERCNKSMVNGDGAVDGVEGEILAELSSPPLIALEGGFSDAL